MREIQLTRGFTAKVDDADAELLSIYKWYALPAGKTVYAMRRSAGKSILMHRQILNAAKGEQVDHADHDGLNNQRSNIRLCTASQNSANRRSSKNNGLGFKGVFPFRGKYIAQMHTDGREVYLGFYKCPIEAARAYDAAALKQWGEFALCNFPHTHK